MASRRYVAVIANMAIVVYRRGCVYDRVLTYAHVWLDYHTGEYDCACLYFTDLCTQL